jgi:hypothetical protein
MLLIPVYGYNEILSDYVEIIGDYATLHDAFSVLKLSNDSVSGYITSCYRGEENMSLIDFQVLLNSKLN